MPLPITKDLLLTSITFVLTSNCTCVRIVGTHVHLLVCALGDLRNSNPSVYIYVHVCLYLSVLAGTRVYTQVILIKIHVNSIFVLE